jgi:uncharacterized protein YndB with AHSA1/START domain
VSSRATIPNVAAEITLKLSSSVQAPPQRVFEAMTDPDQVTEWWGPRGIHLS